MSMEINAIINTVFPYALAIALCALIYKSFKKQINELGSYLAEAFGGAIEETTGDISMS